MKAQKLEPFFYFAAGGDFAVFIVGVRGEKGLVPDFLSVWIIVNNNPVNFTDPSGQSAGTAVGAAMTCACLDGPLPFGDMVGCAILICVTIETIEDPCDPFDNQGGPQAGDPDCFGRCMEICLGFGIGPKTKLALFPLCFGACKTLCF